MSVETSIQKILKHHHVVNVSCKNSNDLNFKHFETKIFSYTCQRIDKGSHPPPCDPKYQKLMPMENSSIGVLGEV